MNTVRAWAAANGYDYEFIDDRMFEYAPDWYRAKVNNNILLISDLARLEIAKEYLSGQYERTIWVDADILIFDQNNFFIPVVDEFAFCREVWLSKTNNYGLRRLFNKENIYCTNKVNNAVTVFTRNNGLLDFYIHACKYIVQNKSGGFSGLEVGTRFLTHLYRALSFSLLNNVGLFSPPLLDGVFRKDKRLTREYMRNFKNPIYAVNLCGSARNQVCDGVDVTDNLLQSVVDYLLITKGAGMNIYADDLNSQVQLR